MPLILARCYSRFLFVAFPSIVEVFTTKALRGQGAQRRYSLSFVSLPGKWLAKMEEPAARAIVGKCGELCAGLSAFANFHRSVWAAHLSFYPAGMRGVHFDFAVAQFVG